MPKESSAAQPGNAGIATFYDWAYWAYPLVDWFCSRGRRRVIEKINQLPRGRLLEIGVGPGRHLRLYRQHQITAIDCSARMVASSRLHCSAADIQLMDGEQLGFGNATFDYVALCHVLSVTTDPERMLTEAHRVLRPGGLLFVLNHETPKHAWRHVEALVTPFARWLRFRSQFRLEDLSGADRFRTKRLESTDRFGLMKAYSLEK